MRRASGPHRVRDSVAGAPSPGALLAPFVLAFVVGLAWTFGLLYAAKGSAFLLTGEWAWSPFGDAGGATDAFAALLAAAPDASPPAMLAAAALPCVALSLFARPGLGRYLFGPRPRRSSGRGWGPEQLPRLVGLGLALLLFLILGGAS